MVVVKLIIRILLLPVYISLTIVQLVVMFVTWLSATVFHILSGIICITAILGYGFGQETGTETIRMLGVRTVCVAYYCKLVRCVAGSNKNQIDGRLKGWN